MKKIETKILIIVALFFFLSAFVGKKIMRTAKEKYDAIYSGVPWFDNNGNAISAHGACIIKEGKKYYLFGERHTDTGNAFVGFNCYSSTDLCNWNFESVALPVQKEGKLGKNRIGERVKVMKCPSTGEYIMYMHVDTLSYSDQFIGYATSKLITGPYVFQGPILFKGKPIYKWDMGAFQDADGSGYILIHGGGIYKLSNDYKNIVAQTNNYFTSGFEAPTLFRRGNMYYFIGSQLTGWERNDNYYFTATSLKGPWTAHGTLAPNGALTWNSQSTFVVPVEGANDTTYMFMGDRWSYPRQASAATYVWQPLTFSGNTIALPKYQQAWRIDEGKAIPVSVVGRTIISGDTKEIHYTGQWKKESIDTSSVYSSATKGDNFSISFEGTQVAFFGQSRPDGGYADVVLKKSNGDTVLTSIVDTYCKYPFSELKFISPSLPKGNYTLSVSVEGDHWKWVDKNGSASGSNGNVVALEKIVVKQ